MEKRLITGNEALALGALRAGVRVVTGYPGTPSTGALESLLARDLPGRHVEWSTNEKVALEVATGASWAGHRALCTMKMSGVNVALDTLVSVAYSGCDGGLVIYVADDPGTSAGMVEQDSRWFAAMCDLPMLEAASVSEAYTLIQAAFDLSEKTRTPVFVRLVGAISNSYSIAEIDDPVPPAERPPLLVRDIAKYTKAGAAISMAQHRDVIARLEKAGDIIETMGLNRLELSKEPNGLGIIAAGVTAGYLPEGFELAAGSLAGFDRSSVSVLRVAGVHPCPVSAVQTLLRHCKAILVLEELEPLIERSVYVEAHRLRFEGQIVGKLDGTFSRIGEYGVIQVVRGIAAALGMPVPESLCRGYAGAEQMAAARPITVCAGCPHRGTYMAINQAIRKLKLKPDQVMVTGDIGCTILGMNPPFNTVWNEVSMGASVSLAQGFVQGGVQTPVIATIGDSTFFHAGIPGLVNAVQHQVPLTLVIMDNGWTAMTGMQINPGTGEGFQGQTNRRVDIANIIPALGVEHFFIIDPFDLEGSARTIQHALTLPGVKVVLARQECAIQAMRRGVRAGKVTVVPERCNLCKLCITNTGCAAIAIAGDTVTIDSSLCYGCGICVEVCKRDAILEDMPA